MKQKHIFTKKNIWEREYLGNQKHKSYYPYTLFLWMLTYSVDVHYLPTVHKVWFTGVSNLVQKNWQSPGVIIRPVQLIVYGVVYFWEFYCYSLILYTFWTLYTHKTRIELLPFFLCHIMPAILNLKWLIYIGIEKIINLLQLRAWHLVCLVIRIPKMNSLPYVWCLT